MQIDWRWIAKVTLATFLLIIFMHLIIGMGYFIYKVAERRQAE